MYLAYWKDELVAFISTLNMPSGTMKYAHREHRLVVLPDYQGLGIGTNLSNFIGDLMLSKGRKYYSRSTHTRLGHSRRLSGRWISTSKDNLVRSGLNKKVEGTTQSKKYALLDESRKAHSFQYVGGDYNNRKWLKIIGSSDTSYEKAKKIIEKYNNRYFIVIVTGIASQRKINNWERLALERGIRTEVLYLKNKGNYLINKNALSEGGCVVGFNEYEEESIRGAIATID